MAEESVPWVRDGGGDEGPYSADFCADLWFEMLWQTDQAATEAVVKGFWNELDATVPLANTVRIDTGGGMVKGHLYRNTSAVDVDIPTPVGATRVDRIVLRCDWSAQTVRIYRIAGTEKAGVPALTQDDGVTWDAPLWQVQITTGGNITLTDERGWFHPGARVGTDNLDDRAVTEAKQALGTYLPIGGITWYYGSLDATGNYPQVGGVVHTNWHVCNGNDGTPDLRDRFLVGAGNAYAQGDTGGATSHTHEVHIASDLGGSHDHTTDPCPSWGQNWGPDGGAALYALASHTHPVSLAPAHQHGVNGESYAASTLPPYYGLYLIMRIA